MKSFPQLLCRELTVTEHFVGGRGDKELWGQKLGAETHEQATAKVLWEVMKGQARAEGLKQGEGCRGEWTGLNDCSNVSVGTVRSPSWANKWRSRWMATPSPEAKRRKSRSASFVCFLKKWIMNLVLSWRCDDCKTSWWNCPWSRYFMGKENIWRMKMGRNKSSALSRDSWELEHWKARL